MRTARGAPAGRAVPITQPGRSGNPHGLPGRPPCRRLAPGVSPHGPWSDGSRLVGAGPRAPVRPVRAHALTSGEPGRRRGQRQTRQLLGPAAWRHRSSGQPSGTRRRGPGGRCSGPSGPRRRRGHGRSAWGSAEAPTELQHHVVHEAALTRDRPRGSCRLGGKRRPGPTSGRVRWPITRHHSGSLAPEPPRTTGIGGVGRSRPIRCCRSPGPPGAPNCPGTHPR